MRSGEASGLKALEAKALSRGSGPDGGYLVPLPTEREVLRRLAKFSPIRAISSVREISGASLRRAFSTTGPAAGWVAEADPRPQTNNQQLADMTFPAMELYAMPAATQTLLDDAVVDIEQWIAEEVQTAFAEQEGAAFVNGDGVNKPKGFLSYTTVADASWTWGNIGYVADRRRRRLRRDAILPTRLSISSMRCARAIARTANSSWAGARNRSCASSRRRPAIISGRRPQPPTRGASLMNFPVVEAEDMPDPAANSSLDRLRRFRARLCGGRPRRHSRAARSLLRQALCALLHDEARRRRRAEFRGDQAVEIRRVVTARRNRGRDEKRRGLFFL